MYDQELPQSHTEDQPTTQRGRPVEHPGRTQNKIVSRAGWVGGPDNVFFNHQRISQRAVQTSREMQLNQIDPIVFQGGPHQNFQGNI